MKKLIGQNLKKFREANKLTQEQVALFLNLERSTYSNYELGEREMPVEYLEKVADLFGCEMYLFFEEQNKVADMLTCAFRIDNLSSEDMNQIALFKGLVKNYLKMNQML